MLSSFYFIHLSLWFNDYTMEKCVYIHRRQSAMWACPIEDVNLSLHKHIFLWWSLKSFPHNPVASRLYMSISHVGHTAFLKRETGKNCGYILTHHFMNPFLITPSLKHSLRTQRSVSSATQACNMEAIWNIISSVFKFIISIYQQYTNTVARNVLWCAHKSQRHNVTKQ